MSWHLLVLGYQLSVGTLHITSVIIFTPWPFRLKGYCRCRLSVRPSVRPDQTGPKTSPEPHRRIADPHRRITINILEILEPPIFAYHTYYTSKHMYNWMKWLRLLGGWHFIGATAIKPPKAACQFAADDILLYKFCYNIQWIYFTIWEKGKEELSPLQYHFKSLHIISSLYISYQDITRRVC